MSISNNIAEGSGSFSDKEFASFLNMARRSDFECVNILHIFERRKIISSEEKQLIRNQLLILSKKITSFRKKLI
jgi:four helix bundle protein